MTVRNITRVLLFVSVALRLSAQIEVVSGGKVGIGTTSSPISKLHVLDGSNYVGTILADGPAAGYSSFGLYENGTYKASIYWHPGEAGVGFYGASKWFFESGNVGIGTASPVASLDVNGSLLVTGGAAGAGTYGVKAIGAAGADRDIFMAGSAGLSNGFTVQRVSSAMKYVFNDGNVGIGTTSPSQKLEVAGSVKATSFISSTTTYADFVFHPDYQLPTLAETEAAIRRDGHLPGIPSEAEAREHGIDLSAMQVRLLQKVEELTLHQIAQQKEIEALKAQNARLQRRLTGTDRGEF